MADAAADMEEGGMVRTLKDLFAGAAGGIAQVLLGKLVVVFLHFTHSNCPIIVIYFQVYCFISRASEFHERVAEYTEKRCS
jgi:hypothetical protein